MPTNKTQHAPGRRHLRDPIAELLDVQRARAIHVEHLEPVRGAYTSFTTTQLHIYTIYSQGCVSIRTPFIAE